MTSGERRALGGLIAPAFHEAHKAVRRGQVGELVLTGGRGSAKSSYAAIELLVQLMRHPDCHAVALRRVGRTLRTSVWSQLLWALERMGLDDEFEPNVSRMELVRKTTGQCVWCFGLDDAAKLKSIKPPFGYIGAVWFEELDQFSGPDQVRSAEQSLLRGQGKSLVIKSFNPPPLPSSWVNRYVRQPKPGMLVVHSDYRSLPPHWLGERFLQEAEHLRRTNERAYRHEYLGQVVGSGSLVFENVKLVPIPEEAIARLERRYHGVDWGWFPDPWAFNSCGYDAARRVLYIFDEATRRRTSNADTARILLEKGVCAGDSETLIADSAEEKSCRDYRSLGLPCRGAEKGPGSVKAGMKWLQSLAEIRIDPARCPDTAKEFSEYEYDRDRSSGQVLEGYPDRDNHHIDAVRYATSRIWRRAGG